jgi:hypothetical protein
MIAVERGIPSSRALLCDIDAYGQGTFGHRRKTPRHLMTATYRTLEASTVNLWGSDRRRPPIHICIYVLRLLTGEEFGNVGQ